MIPVYDIEVNTFNPNVEPDVHASVNINHLSDNDKLDILSCVSFLPMDEYMRFNGMILKEVPTRIHKKKRIQKKWIKRYGTVKRYVPTLMRGIAEEIRWDRGEVLFSHVSSEI